MYMALAGTLRFIGDKINRLFKKSQHLTSIVLN